MRDVRIIFCIKRIVFNICCWKLLLLIKLFSKFFFKDFVFEMEKNFLIMNVKILVVIVVKLGNLGIVFCRRVFVFVELIIFLGLRVSRYISVLRKCCLFGDNFFILFLKVLLI